MSKWSCLRIEIEQVCKHLDLPTNQLRPLNILEWKEIEDKICRTFFELAGSTARPTWLWNNFKGEITSQQFQYTPLWALNKLVNPKEVVWLIVNETVNERDKFWFYEGYIEPICQVLGECYNLDEIYVVSKKYEWLLCIDDHDILIAAGTTMPALLQKLELHDLQ